MSRFNIYFDYASIPIFIVVLLLYAQQNVIRNRVHYAYIGLWISAFITPIFDIFSVYAMEYRMPRVFLLTNSVYYLGLQWTGFFFFIFTVSPITRRIRTSIIQKLIISVPILFTTGMVITNLFVPCIFEYTPANDTYVYYWGLNVCYIVGVLYYLNSVYFVLKSKDIYNRHTRFAILNTVLIVVFTLLGQFLFPKYLILSFAISLSMVQLIMVTINQDINKDPQTGLLSRNAFYEIVRGIIYNKINFNVVAIRIPDYEVILATYGLTNLHSFENELCSEMNKYIPKNCGFKLNDDIIAILYENQSDEDNDRIVKQIDDLLTRKWTVNGVDISFSHFVVTFKYPEHFKNHEQLVSLMVYLEKTKRMRYGIMPVEEFVIRDLHREQDVEHALFNALKNDLFEIYYQPIYDTRTKKFVSAEALIRLNNSCIGSISPGDFIPIAEKSGLIIQIGDLVIDKVCKFISETDFDALGLEYIEVNLSTIQCLQRNFFTNLLTAIKKYGVDPSKICFEITETASNCAPEIFSQNLRLLHDEGFKLAIDDFGTGYGNLQRLISMEFDIVKFDNLTTFQICVDEKIRPIFSKMITMIHSMNAQVVAEGVEEKDQLDFLSKIGTDYIQGFYFSRALPEKEFLMYINQH